MRRTGTNQRCTRGLTVLLAAVAAVLLHAPEAAAIPAFARATGVNCVGCHTVYPALNEAGERFRLNGFRFSSAKDEPWRWREAQTFLEGVPLAFRAVAAFVATNDRSQTPNDGDPNYKRVASTFEPVEAAVIVAGNLAPHYSVWADHDFGTGDAVNEGYLRLNAVETDWLNARAGSFELDIPFTVAKTPNLFDYLIYDVADAAGLTNPFTFAEPQIGLEVGGHQGLGLRYSVAAVNGSNNAPDNDGLRSGYARVSVGPYRLRFGVAGLAGTAGIAPGSAGAATPYRTDHFQRVEADLDLHAGWWRIYGLYLLGHDAAGIAAGGRLHDIHYDGGFLQVEYLWNKPHVQFAVRYDHVHSRAFQALGVWEKTSEDAVTPQVILLVRPDIQLKTALQLLRDPGGESVRTAQVALDWAVY